VLQLDKLVMSRAPLNGYRTRERKHAAITLGNRADGGYGPTPRRRMTALNGGDQRVSEDDGLLRGEC
jgi:hypothetical protein